jgi:hypothetical protein
MFNNIKWNDAIKDPYFFGFIILMVIDAIITIFLRFNADEFSELNMLFSQFITNPFLFSVVIVVGKIVGICLIYKIIVFCRKKDRAGDIITSTSISVVSCGGMFLVLSYMMIGNLVVNLM